MTPERWDILSGWLNAWLAADTAERERLRTQLIADHPDLVVEAETLTSSSGKLPGFLETPALVLAARELVREDPVLAPGAEIGPYRIVSFLARGGMGDVYRATDVRLHRDVALKVLAQTKTGDPGRVERFMHEARVTAALDHPNVVRVFDVGRLDDRAYLVAELLEGETLRERIARGPMPISEVQRIGIEIGRGLVAAHAAGLVHRDLKPENIFLTRSGTTKLLDFGIAKLAQDETVRDGFSTLTGVVLGTAGYLAPEQIRGQAIDARADLFAFGSVLFEMLTGTRAFAREHIVETLHAILHDATPDPGAERPDVPPQLAGIVARLLEKSPDARFQSSSEVIAALEQVDPAAVVALRRQPVARSTQTTAGALASQEATPRRSKAVWAAAVVSLVLAIATAAFYWRDLRSPAAVETPPVTLAVMPFRSIPADRDSDLFGMGFSDVFIGRLSQLRDVRVLPLTATQRLRGQDPIDAARALGATHVLTVTLQREGGKVRATPQLVAAADGRMIWSTNAESEASSLFSIQDIIVRQLIDELAPQLAAGTSSRLARSGTRNNEAFEAYTRGRAHVLRPTPTDLKRAAQLFEQAVSLDPNFADAWAGLGSAYKRMPAVIGISGDMFEKARDAANRALELDPQHAEAYSVLGTVAFWYEWDYPKAEELLKRSLDLQSGSSDAQLFLAHLYSNTGRHDEALEEIRRSRSLDFSWPLPNALEGEFLYHARRYDAALAHLNALVEVEPEFWVGHNFRTFPLIALQRYEEALESCDRVLAIRRRIDSAEPPYLIALALKGFAFARLQRTSEAESILEELRSRARQEKGQPSHEALVLHALGRNDDALARLRDAVSAHDVHLTFLAVDHKWDAMRDLPGFKDVLKRVNLLDVSERMQR